ncbi:hypothetical protein MATL_G00226650 [Megalops atlanticus]|uniref:Peptidase S1 domain-containing protein n=1 Tax=Megalops atlanticus TaxID=7932 RepID=A0A9D3PJ78_MEGAT|nr:hypothetical protein MATL_G00226650 [Megalops atlanticus]
MMRILLLLPLLGLAGSNPVEVNETIIGGWDCKPHEAQYQVFVTDGSYICGGSLLSSSWVLTAAHCDSPGLKVYIGIHNRDVIKHKNVQPFYVKSKRDPGYNQKTTVNDIMLIKLKKNVPSPKIVKLPTECRNYPDKAPEGKDLLLSGWGRLKGENKAKLPSKLQCVKIRKAKCPEEWSVTSDAFCAGKEYQKSRGGDSGGGLVLTEKNEVYGVVKAGSKRDDEYPGMLTSVCFHLPWIKNVTNLH